MKSATVNELRKELKECDPDVVRDLCLRLIKYKKENKELATYALFEAHDEQAYVKNVTNEIEELFNDIPRGGNTYYIKKTVRKILRFANRQIKYSGNKVSELEIRIFFCEKIIDARVPKNTGTVLGNLYDQQLKKITSIVDNLEEDLQADYQAQLERILR
ncbi:MAG TPA: hypothetical protein VGD65_14310 [Chryseosolibacter sp.]